MLASSIPSKIQLPFANSGTKTTIPVSSQIGITPGAASYTDGFPPLTMTPVASGGVPPYGADFNGVLNAITAVQQWQSAGGVFKYDSAFATAIGGYPAGSVLESTDGVTQWISLIDNNSANPDGATPTGWAALASYGITSIALTNANVTLTSLQYAKRKIILTGTLTGNVQIIFPTLLSDWLVINNTTGAFTVTCKTSAGTGLAVATGGMQQFYGDGTNLVPVSYGISQTAADTRYAGAMPNFTASTSSALITASLGIGKIDFRNAVLATGTPVEYNVTTPLTLAMTSIAGSLGATTAVATSLIYAIVYAAGVPQLAVANISGGLQMDETNLITTTAIGAGSTAANVWYSTSAIAIPSQYRIIGRVDATWTSGTGWGAPTTVQPIGSGQTNFLGSVGYGQLDRDVTSTRTLGTVYYTINPINISVYLTSTADTVIQVTVDGVTSIIGRSNGAGFGVGGSKFIHAGAAYTVSTSAGTPTLQKWTETS